MFDLLVESYVNQLIENIIKKIDVYPENKCLVSVVLSGSLGREEGTFHFDSKTSGVVLDSDVELALIYKFGEKKRAEVIRRKLIQDFKEEMNPMTISVSRVKNGYNFNYSILPPEYSSIFMYDLYNGSKTIWGKDLLNKKVVQYDLYEAKRIVANRIGELTYTETNSLENVESLVRQWECKLLLALGSAYCILGNAYSSQYGVQRSFIVKNKKQVNDMLGRGFVEDYDKAYLFLRKGHPYCEVSRDQLRQYVKNIKYVFEEKKLLIPKINSISRKLKYAIVCIKTKKKFNPFTCEKDILDGLLQNFIFDDDAIVSLARDWKDILY